MRRALAVLVTLLTLAPAVVLAGCVNTETEVFGPGPSGSFRRGTVVDVEEASAKGSDRSVPADDPDAPPTFHDGVPQRAVALAVRERDVERRVQEGRVEVSPASQWRYPCGGAVLAIGEGAPDPRTLLLRGAGQEDLPPVTYDASRMVTDGWGREWTTDRYVVTQETTGREWRIWVANVHGGLAYEPDDGHAHCDAFAYGSTAFNTIVHTWGYDGMVDLYFSPIQRFPVPDERHWVLGPVE